MFVHIRAFSRKLMHFLHFFQVLEYMTFLRTQELASGIFTLLKPLAFQRVLGNASFVLRPPQYLPNTDKKQHFVLVNLVRMLHYQKIRKIYA